MILMIFNLVFPLFQYCYGNGSLSGSMSDQLSINTSITEVSQNYTTEKINNRIYTDVEYSSSQNIDFRENYYNIKNVTGHINFTATNNTNGNSQAIRINKSTAQNIDLNFNAGSFVSPAIKCISTNALYTSGSPAKITLSGAKGAIFLITCEYIKEIPYIFVDQIGSENAVVTDANQQTLFVQNNLAAAPANLSENTVISYTIPPNTLNENSQLHVRFVIRTIEAKEKVTFKCKIGDVVLNELTFSQNSAILREGFMYNNGSISNQNYFSHNMAQDAGSGIWPTMFYTSNIDFSKPVTVTFTVKKLNAADKAEIGFVTLTGNNL